MRAVMVWVSVVSWLLGTSVAVARPVDAPKAAPARKVAGDQFAGPQAPVPGISAPGSSASAASLRFTEAARIERLRAVAASHRITSIEARHAADSQLLVGALIMVASMLTPVFAELRDEDFPAYGSILLGSIGLFVVIEGSIDEQQVQQLQIRETLQANEPEKTP